MHMHVSADACMAGNNTSNGVAVVIAAAALSDSPLCPPPPFARPSEHQPGKTVDGLRAVRSLHQNAPACLPRQSGEHVQIARITSREGTAAAQKVFAVAVASRHNHPAPAPAPRSIRKFPIAPPLPFLQPTQQHCFLLCDVREMRNSASTPGLDRLISAD